jgi:hypothetical protein
VKRKPVRKSKKKKRKQFGSSAAAPPFWRLQRATLPGA